MLRGISVSSPAPSLSCRVHVKPHQAPLGVQWADQGLRREAQSQTKPDCCQGQSRRMVPSENEDSTPMIWGDGRGGKALRGHCHQEGISHLTPQMSVAAEQNVNGRELAKASSNSTPNRLRLWLPFGLRADPPHREGFQGWPFSGQVRWGGPGSGAYPAPS